MKKDIKLFGYKIQVLSSREFVRIMPVNTSSPGVYGFEVASIKPFAASTFDRGDTYADTSMIKRTYYDFKTTTMKALSDFWFKVHTNYFSPIFQDFREEVANNTSETKIVNNLDDLYKILTKRVRDFRHTNEFDLVYTGPRTYALTYRKHWGFYTKENFGHFDINRNPDKIVQFKTCMTKDIPVVMVRIERSVIVELKDKLSAQRERWPQ